jgi:hypothetical protein
MVSAVSSGNSPTAASPLKPAVLWPGRSFEHLKVLARIRREVMVAADHRARLQPVDQVVGLAQAPIGLFAVPPAVEPDAGYRAVIRQQFGELGVHEIDVGVPVARVRAAGMLARPAARVVVILVPIELRVVEKQPQAVPAASVGQLREDVLAVHGAVDNVPVAVLRIEQRETVVVLRGDRDVPHAGVFRQQHPFRHRIHRRRMRQGLSVDLLVSITHSSTPITE